MKDPFPTASIRSGRQAFVTFLKHLARNPPTKIADNRLVNQHDKDIWTVPAASGYAADTVLFKLSCWTLAVALCLRCLRYPYGSRQRHVQCMAIDWKQMNWTAPCHNGSRCYARCANTYCNEGRKAKKSVGSPGLQRKCITGGVPAGHRAQPDQAWQPEHSWKPNWEWTQPPSSVKSSLITSEGDLQRLEQRQGLCRWKAMAGGDIREMKCKTVHIISSSWDYASIGALEGQSSAEETWANKLAQQFQ